MPRNILMSTAAVIALAAAPAFAQEADSDTAPTTETQNEMSDSDAPQTNGEDGTEATDMESDGAMTDEAPARDALGEDSEDTDATDSEDLATADMDNTAMSDGDLSAYDGMMVADLIGTEVLDGNGEVIGEVDRIVEKDGEVSAIVGVGGFLGLLENDVVLPLAQFSYANEQLMLSGMTDEELQNMPEYSEDEVTEIDGDMPINSTE